MKTAMDCMHRPFRATVKTFQPLILLASALLAASSLLFSSMVSAVGFDQLDNLNAIQDTAADTWQGPEDENGNRPGADPTAPNAGLCVNMNPAENTHPGVVALAQRCAELVETADPGTIDPSLNLGVSSDEVNGYLQQIVTEESEMIGSRVADTSNDQLQNIAGRLQVLRTGGSTLAVSGIHFGGDQPSGGNAGSEEISRWGFFINGSYDNGDRDETYQEAGYDFDGYTLTAGTDYGFTDSIFGGVAFSYHESDVDADLNDSSFDNDGYSLTLYGTYYRENWYLEGSLGYGTYNHKNDRTIDYGTGDARIVRTSSSDTDSDQLLWSAALGYTNGFGRFNYNLYARAEGVYADVDEYDESGTGAPDAIGGNEWAMHVEDQDIDSLQLVLGGQVAYVFSTAFGVIQPFLGAEAHHEFEDEARIIESFYLNDPFYINGDRSYPVEIATDDPDEDFFIASAGTSLVLAGGTQMFINYDTVLGLDEVTSETITVGVRFEL